MRTYELFINGEFIPNGDREMLQVINPATEEVISEVPKATAADVEAASRAERVGQNASHRTCRLRPRAGTAGRRQS